MDIAISWKQLRLRFKAVKSGEPGFYIYKADLDKALYVATAGEVKQVLSDYSVSVG